MKSLFVIITLGVVLFAGNVVIGETIDSLKERNNTISSLAAKM